jgi:hypothetical protein
VQRRTTIANLVHIVGETRAKFGIRDVAHSKHSF